MLAAVNTLEGLFGVLNLAPRFAYLQASVAAFDAEVANGTIYNVTATKVKDDLSLVSRAFEKARFIAGYGSADAISLGELYDELPYSIDGGNCKKALRTLTEVTELKTVSISKELADALTLQLVITKAYAACIEELRAVKDNLIKGRVPKAIDDSFKNKRGSAASVELITSKLAIIVKPELDSLEAQMTKWHAFTISKLEALGTEIFSSELTPTMMYAFTRCFDFKSINFKTDQHKYIGITPNTKAKTYATDQALLDRKSIEDQFMFKNILKLSNLIDKKGELAALTELPGIPVKIHNGTGTLTTSLRFDFVDGASFIVRNKVIINRSPVGRVLLSISNYIS